MREFIRVLSALTALLAALLLPLALFGYNFGQVAYSREALLAVVTTEAFSLRVVEEARAAALADAAEGALTVDNLVVHTVASLAEVSPELRELLLPRAFLEELARQIIDDGFAWYEGTETVPVFALDLQPFTGYWRSNVPQMVDTTLALLPVCTPEEVANQFGSLLGSLLGGELRLDTMPTCVPEIVPVDLIAQPAEQLLYQQLEVLPESFTFDATLGLTPEGLTWLKSRLHTTELLMQWGAVFLLFLLFLGAVFAGSRLRDSLKWLGALLLLAAFLTLLLGGYILLLWQPTVFPFLSSWPDLLRLPLAAIFNGLVRQAAEPLLPQALFGFLLGLLLLLGGWLVGRTSGKIS